MVAYKAVKGCDNITYNMISNELMCQGESEYPNLPVLSCLEQGCQTRHINGEEI